MKNRLTLPLGVAFVALVFYALTVSRTVTLASLPFTMKIAGWDWQPMSARPLAWLLTLPVRLLSPGMIPCALNFLSAIFAAATLGVLARSVQRLDWDCPPDPRQPWAQRLPALLACAGCGLEFNFWQDATAMTGEMLDVLLLAAGILCGLEFRAGKNPRWLDAAAVVWGAGMVENWAMLLLLPVFAGLLAWLPGWRKLGKPFARRLGVLAVTAGVLYSLQPLANALPPDSPWTMREAWTAEWQALKFTLQTLYFGFWSWHRMLTVTVLLFFLLPVLACCLRIKNEAAQNVFGVERAQVWIFRGLRLGLLAACLWLLFDPGAAPRGIMLDKLRLAMPLLTLDYLLALGAAFLAGSLLFAAQVPPRARANSTPAKTVEFFRRRAPVIFAVLSLAVVAALAARSWPGIRLAQLGSIAAGGDLISRALPAAGGLLLANDPTLLLAVESSLARRGESRRWQTVDWQQLPGAKYRAALARRAAVAWPTNAPQDLTPAGTLAVLQQLAANRRIFYLQPEPGYFLFEQFYALPGNAVHELKPFAGNEFSGPPLTARQLADQEQFWDNAWAGQLEAWSKLGPAAAGSFPRRGGLQPVKPEAPRQTCRWFSALLNDWGVELQRAGNFPAARKRFAQALALNPENPAPPLNLIVNSNLLAGHAMDLSAARSLARDLAGIQQLARLMEISGALDEPVICALCGDACNNAGWPRQALAQLDRARQLAPDSVAPELMMAKIYARHALPDQVFGLAAHLRGYVTNTPAGQALDLELSVVEAKAWMDRTNLAEANRVLNTVLEKNPGNYGAAETVFNAFLAFGSPTNALALLDRMLAQEPDNIPALNNKAALLIQLQRAGEALPVLARALALTNQPAIRLNQALALMQEKKFPAAEQVYLGLRETGADPFRIEYGLAQIAEARQDTNTAVREYRLCLSNAPPDSANWQNASARLDALRKK